MNHKLILCLYYAISLFACSGLCWSIASCRDVNFLINATASNRVAESPPKDLYSDPQAVNRFLNQPIRYQNVSGLFRIHGQLCYPSKPASKLGLQVLVHGVTYSHTYWAGLQTRPDKTYNIRNSWVHYAAANGYFTLSLDRLGSGASDHPNPISVVQDPIQVEILHRILSAIRNHDYLGLGFTSSYGDLIYVGHSFGSGLGVHLASKHPASVDALVLTGIAVVGGNPSPGSFLHRWAQASEAFPSRFSAAIFTPGYLVSTNKTGRRDNFYSNPEYDFDNAILERDWKTEGTLTLGEQLTVAEYLVQPPVQFSKPVFITTGRRDAIFCSDNGSRALGPVDCGIGPESLVSKTKQWFAGVPEDVFESFVQEDAGHCHQLHYSAKEGFRKVHKWLKQVQL